MRLQPKNLNKVRVVTLCYIEIFLQVVFQICFCIPALHWAVNNIRDRVDSIQSGINPVDHWEVSLSVINPPLLRAPVRTYPGRVIDKSPIWGLLYLEGPNGHDDILPIHVPPPY